MNWLRLLFPLILMTSLSAPALAGPARVVDGDTLILDGTTYRLNGIDAPEHGQKCGSWACGNAATDRLAKMVDGRSVTCKGVQKDGYGRTIATCWVGGTDIGAQMVQDGMAWAFERFSTAYVPQQRAAKAKGIGIWSGSYQPAWDYRQGRWTAASSAAPEGCPIKGNISRNGRIYHPPWSPWYARTKINTAKGERWFCSEADALAAGWRAPIWD